MRLSLLCLSLAACAAPSIVVPPATDVAKTERRARAVEVCVLFQEQGSRPLFQGVAEFSFAEWKYAIASIAVQHPSGGLLIIDPAFGRSIADDLARAGPVAMSLFGDARTKTPLVDVMEAAGLSPADAKYALITHAHWDHAGGLGDLPQAKVLIPRAELQWAKGLTRFFDDGAMPHHLKRAKQNMWLFDFTGPAVDGFEKSFDVFGDGAVVAVPLPGHTPGSLGVFVKGADVTWFFTGDTTWTARGVELPAHKFIKLDHDLEAVATSIGKLHALQKYRPDVRVVPAHDGAVLTALPRCQKR